MTYGSYLSAAGMLTSSHRIDVLANNLANADTTGFRRAVSVMSERPTPQGNRHTGDPEGMLRELGGGHWIAPTRFDNSPGPVEATGNPLDVAMIGDGYLSVSHPAGMRLTRDGSMMINDQGYLVSSTDADRQVLDVAGNPIQLNTADPARLEISPQGVIEQDGVPVAQLAVMTAPVDTLIPAGGNLLEPRNPAQVTPMVDPSVRSGFLESANLDAATELTQLIDAQRQLEANANMIKIQDETVGRAIQVGKI